LGRKRWGDDGYVMEELVAELGAAFLCADLELTPEPRSDHTSYLDHWLKVLKSDNRAIFAAASHARRAADFLHSPAVSNAQENGLVARNVVREMRSSRRRGKERQAERRAKPRLKIGVDIPTGEEIRAIVCALEGRWRPLLLTAIFTGLRASELRGLRWVNVDLRKRELHVPERADKYNQLGRPKSGSGERTVPMTPMVESALRKWKPQCPKGELGLVFPTPNGKVQGLSIIVRRGFVPAQIAAEVTTVVPGAHAKPIKRAKYPGLHALRHFYASWCINRQADGGLELPPKVVQERLGHSTIAMTLDVYRHLFPRHDDSKELAAAERALLA
jgi:integrase